MVARYVVEQHFGSLCSYEDCAPASETDCYQAVFKTAMALCSKQRKSQVKRTGTVQRLSLQKRVARQKKALLSLAGIGASGFTDISVEHDTYLHEKP